MTTSRVHAATAAAARAADDDERDLQRKALAQWERQREVWQRMQQALEAKRSAATATRYDDNNNSSTRRYARTLLSTSTWRARERNEDLSLLQLAVPRSALTSHRVWESTLRNNDDDDVVDEDHDDDADRNTRRPRRRTAHERCVQLGKACYPYALFGKVRDATALPPSSTSLARVVSDAHEHDNNDNYNDDNADETAIASVAAAQRRRRAHATLLQRRQQATTRRARDDADADDNDNTYSSALQRQLTLADAAAAAAANGDDDHDATATRRRAASVDDYYARQLHLFAPYVQKRLPHFLLPRSFLCVHGQPAPCVRASDCSNNTRINSNNDGVEYVAPLPPRSLYAVANTRACVTAATNNDNDDDDVTAAASSNASTVAARVHTAPPSPRATSDDDAKNNNDDNNNIAASDDDDDDDGEATATHDATPRVVLSTSQLLFRAVPGELVHGHVDIRNTSRLTVYYSWRHTRLVDSDDEDEEELQARQGDNNNNNNNDSSNNNDNNDNDNTNDEARRLRVLRRRLYAHAHHARRARHLVYLVSGVNGVLLPHRTRRLAVAFRAPHAGYFCHTYELLTVPTCVERVTLTLCAHVQSRDAAARVVAAPVARALRTRATRDAQRQLLQHLVRAPAPYDAADVDASVARVRAAHDVAAAARAREVAAQRQAWCVANRATFDELPYNIAVYAHLSRLHDSVAATLHTLATAPPTAATATTTTTTSMTATARRVDDGDTSSPPHTMTPLPAPRWDGSVARLLGDVCEVRDAAARNTLLTAMLTLLRLARVSADEMDAVAVLLRRAALALVLQHDARTLMLQHDELEALQWQSLTRAAAAKASGGSNNTSGGGGSGAAAASAGGGGGAAARKSRSTSLVSNRARQATSSGGNTDGASSAAATSRGASPAGVASGGGGAAVTTALSHGSLATLAATLRGGGGNSSSAAAGTTATLPAVAAQLTSDDVAALQREHDVLLSQRIAALTSTRVARVAAVAAQLRDAVDAGCALPLLDVVHAWRVDEVRVVQAADDMDVDTTSAGILPAKPSKRR